MGAVKTPCLAELAEAFRKGQVTLQDYFDNLLAHVTVGGLAHNIDTPDRHPPTFATADAVAAAFRIWIVDHRCEKVEEERISTLKETLLSAWNSSTVHPDEKLLLSPSSQPILHVLVAIAFVRQHDGLLSHLLSLPPPRETAFTIILRDAVQLDEAHKSPTLWNRILTAGWAPQPADRLRQPKWKAGWFEVLKQGLLATDQDPEDELLPFLRNLKHHHIEPDLQFMSIVLEKLHIPPHTLSALLSVFPARGLPPGIYGDFAPPALASPNCLLVAAASASHQTQAHKCAVLAVLLDQGLSPNWKARTAAPSNVPRVIHPMLGPDGSYDSDPTRMGPLHHAALMGEAEVVELLLKRGASPHFRDSMGSTAREVASGMGADDVKEVLDRCSGGVVGFVRGFFGFRG